MKCNARGFLVFPEQVLAHIYPETEGESGINIFGEESLIPGRPCLLNWVKTLHIEDGKIIAGDLWLPRYRRGRIVYRSSPVDIGGLNARGLLPHEIIYQNLCPH